MKRSIAVDDKGPMDLIAMDRQRNDPRPVVEYDTPGVECAHADYGCCPACMGTHKRGGMRSPLRESVTKVTVIGQRKGAWLAARKFFARSRQQAPV